jgi:uncharacterized protein YbbC (DUF1343 family)
MFLKSHIFVGIIFGAALLLSGCASTSFWGKRKDSSEAYGVDARLLVGAERTSLYLPLLQGKRVGLVVHPASRIGSQHLVDSLLSRGVQIVRIFSPEHGFRGSGDAGEILKDETDTRSGLPIISLYGSRKKPFPQDLAGLDILVFDLQDVGTRFYTYLSTLHYVLEACAENGLPLLVLDRPNPNGHYVDGPVLDPKFSSFVGMHPIPLVHGMTLGELAQMINGECWLKDSIGCNLTVISCKGYYRGRPYELPVAPSPNLPNMRATYLYPSLCLFEGTVVSVGRGTESPFQIYGSPDFPPGPYHFVPTPMPGAKRPLYEGEICNGYDLRYFSNEQARSKAALDLQYLIDFYCEYPDPIAFFLPNKYFDLLAGTDQLRIQIQQGWDERSIRASWQEGLEQFERQRKRYLIYRDFGPGL